MSARSNAVARESREIEDSQSRAIAAREANENKPRTALEAMASRLKSAPSALQNTLKQTVFQGLLRGRVRRAGDGRQRVRAQPAAAEIYAFPKKGGGISPDGRLRRMDQDYERATRSTTASNSSTSRTRRAVSRRSKGILIYRKDRSIPTRCLVYLKEFKREHRAVE
jgi:hypothetical protein